MNDQVEQLRSLAAEALLSDAEKATMKARLMEEMEKKPQVSLVRSPYFSFFSLSITETHRRMVFAAIILVTFLTTSTSVLADRALPGDILYTVKTKVNEPVAGLFATTDFEKAEWNVTLASRRLDEAEKIAGRKDVPEQVKIDHYALLEQQLQSADFGTKGYDDESESNETLLSDNARASNNEISSMATLKSASGVALQSTPAEGGEAVAVSLSLAVSYNESSSDTSINLEERIVGLERAIVAIEERISLGKEGGISKEKLLRLNAQKILIRSYIFEAKEARASGDETRAHEKVFMGEETLPFFLKELPVSNDSSIQNSIDVEERNSIEVSEPSGSDSNVPPLSPAQIQNGASVSGAISDVKKDSKGNKEEIKKEVEKIIEDTLLPIFPL